jgi:hypothetical protein
MIKKLLIVLSLVSLTVFFVGFRTDGYRTGISLSGQATFTRNVLVDTVPGIKGVSTNSTVLVVAKRTTALTGGLTWSYLAAESILVHVLAADTTGAGIVYCWFYVE